MIIYFSHCTIYIVLSNILHILSHLKNIVYKTLDKFNLSYRVFTYKHTQKYLKTSVDIYLHRTPERV